MHHELEDFCTTSLLTSLSSLPTLQHSPDHALSGDRSLNEELQDKLLGVNAARTVTTVCVTCLPSILGSQTLSVMQSLIITAAGSVVLESAEVSGKSWLRAARVSARP